MIFVDTAFLIALFLPGDSLHRRSVEWCKAIGTERLLVSDYVLVETANFLCKPISRPKFAALMEFIKTGNAFERIPGSSESMDAAVTLYNQRNDKSWSLTDCTSFVLMQNRGVTRALAHDQHFEQAGFEALLRRDP